MLVVTININFKQFFATKLSRQQFSFRVIHKCIQNSNYYSIYTQITGRPWHILVKRNRKNIILTPRPVLSDRFLSQKGFEKWRQKHCVMHIQKHAYFPIFVAKKSLGHILAQKYIKICLMLQKRNTLL